MKNEVRKLHPLPALLAAIALPFPASAQSFQSGNPAGLQDRQIAVGITIPIGKGGTQSERAPRVEMTFDHRRRDANGFQIRDVQGFNNKRPVRIGLSLSEKPQMMLNGRELPEMGNRKNISTVAWIGIGVAAAAGIGFLVIADALDCDVRDGDEDCN